MIATISRHLLLISLVFFLSACMLSDRRGPIAVWDDGKTESSIKDKIAKRFSTEPGNHITVTTYNQNVLLTGQVPDTSVKEELSQFASQSEGVKNVYNEVTIGPVTGLVQRTTDTWITSNIKTRFTASNSTGLMHMSVTTENGTVFLMGLVTYEEAETATEKARMIKGVSEVVRLFDYVN